MYYKFNLQEGTLSFPLEQPVEYAFKGDMAKAENLILAEPVKASHMDCRLLTQMIRRINLEAMRAFYGSDFEKKGKEAGEEGGEVVVPYHKRKEIDEKEFIKDVESMNSLLFASSTTPQEFVSLGKKILTTRYSSSEGRRLAYIDDEEKTPVNTYLFDQLTADDQIMIVCAFAIFFGVSSAGQRKIMSSTEQG